MAEGKTCWKTRTPCPVGCDTGHGGVCKNLEEQRRGIAMPGMNGLATAPQPKPGTCLK